jgi:DNA-binding transcriptional MerR regulator
MTIQAAARITGWSARMLRYIERTGLVRAGRSEAGYRLYRAAELERLRTLKELLGRFEISLTDVAFAARLDADPALREAVQTWLNTGDGGVEHANSSSSYEHYENEKSPAALG